MLLGLPDPSSQTNDVTKKKWREEAVWLHKTNMSVYEGIISVLKYTNSSCSCSLIHLFFIIHNVKYLFVCVSAITGSWNYK